MITQLQFRWAAKMQGWHTKGQLTLCHVCQNIIVSHTTICLLNVWNLQPCRKISCTDAELHNGKLYTQSCVSVRETCNFAKFHTLQLCKVRGLTESYMAGRAVEFDCGNDHASWMALTKPPSVTYVCTCVWLRGGSGSRHWKHVWLGLLESISGARDSAVVAGERRTRLWELFEGARTCLENSQVGRWLSVGVHHHHHHHQVHHYHQYHYYYWHFYQVQHHYHLPSLEIARIRIVWNLILKCIWSIYEIGFSVAAKFALRSSFWAGRGRIDQFWRCHQAVDRVVAQQCNTGENAQWTPAEFESRDQG